MCANEDRLDVPTMFINVKRSAVHNILNALKINVDLYSGVWPVNTRSTMPANLCRAGSTTIVIQCLTLCKSMSEKVLYRTDLCR